MKFAVFSDLHYDVIHDSERRLQEFIHSVKRNKVEFIVGLGDLCHPIDEHKHVIDKLNDPAPCYLSIGNHDSDVYPLDTAIDFFRLKNNYYSFIVNDVKFIMLDSNYIRKADGRIIYNQPIAETKGYTYPYIPEEELEWLKKEIQDDHLYYIIFSHHSLTNDLTDRGISNRDEIRGILEDRNREGKRVLLCMNGHDHGDDWKELNGIYYYTLNSMSYIWQGVKPTFNYSEELHKKYPYLKYMILYEEPLHVIITIDEDKRITIEGMEGHYQNITPKDIGLGAIWNAVSIEPKTSSIVLNP